MKIIKYFPLKTRTSAILKALNLSSIQERTKKIFDRFVASRSNNDLISQEILHHKKSISVNPPKRFKPLFDLFHVPIAPKNQ